MSYQVIVKMVHVIATYHYACYGCMFALLLSYSYKDSSGHIVHSYSCKTTCTHMGGPYAYGTAFYPIIMSILFACFISLQVFGYCCYK